VITKSWHKDCLGLFLCSIRKPFLRPDLAVSSPPRADAVKVGRRASRAANSDLARPHLDGAAWLAYHFSDRKRRMQSSVLAGFKNSLTGCTHLSLSSAQSPIIIGYNSCFKPMDNGSMITWPMDGMDIS
jgi:hypothetical protein